MPRRATYSYAAMPSANLLSSFHSSTDGVAYQAVDPRSGDNFERGIYTIRRKPVPSSSLHSIGPRESLIAPQKSATPALSVRTLKRDYLELSFGVLLLALPLPFFALAIYVAHMNSKDLKHDQWQSMQGYMKVVSIPPYITKSNVVADIAKSR
jgi:hypothetical protein